MTTTGVSSWLIRMRQGVPDQDDRQGQNLGPVTVARLDGREIRSKSAALAEIGNVLDFPDYYGCNLDALFECLTDLSWLPPGGVRLIWTDAGVLQAVDRTAYRAIVATLHDAEEEVRRSSARPFTVDLRHDALL